MRTSVITFWVTLVISILSLILSSIFNVYIEDSIYYDIVMGIFSGSILTCGLSIVNYNIEKKKVLENFYVVTNMYIKELAKYDPFGDDYNKKCQFFINYYNLPLMDLRVAFNDIKFLLDVHHSKQYIKEKIYLPLLNVNIKVSKSYWNFKYYDEKVLGLQPKESTEKDIQELEKMLYTVQKSGIHTIYKPNLLARIQEELTTGKFYKLLGKETQKNRKYIKQFIRK